MLYIQKKLSQKLKNLLSEACSSEDWKKISPNDGEGLRIAFDSLAPKSELRKSIKEEQHGLCAYCMCSLKDNFLLEHWAPLSKYKSEGLSYSNLMGCCHGGTNVQHDKRKKAGICCDATKGDKEMTFSPLKLEHIQQITYTREGYLLVPNNPIFMEEINHILCLNGKVDKNGVFVSDTYTQLVLCRRSIYNTCKKEFQTLAKKGKLSSVNLRKIIIALEGQEIYSEFLGVTLYYYKKKLKSLEAQGK